MGRPFYLVQRMTAEDTGRGGFDAYFHLDYMGAAEFEWGALPKSLDRIRLSHRIVTVETPVTHNGESATAYIVGGQTQAKAAAEAIQQWVDDGCRGHERAYFAEHIDGTADNYQKRTNAWWSITDDVMFALDADIAERLVKAVKA